MNISSLMIVRSKFMSNFESFDSEDILGDVYPSMNCTGNNIENKETNLPWGLDIDFKDLKAMFTYFLGIHSLEPILAVTNELIDLTNLNAEYSYTFNAFNQLTTVNNKESFIFRAIKFMDGMLYAYKDIAYQGDLSMYRPFGHTASKALDTKLSVSITDMKAFFNQHFKYTHLRGKALFSSVLYYKKGTIIEITNKKIYLVVTSITISNSIMSYEALVVLKA